MKKIAALILALSLLLSLAACGAKQPAPEETPSTEQLQTTDTPEDREHVTLKFYNRCSEQTDQQRVFDELNKYFEQKYNTTIEWHFLGGTYADKMNVIINSGEEFDACFTSDWLNDYLTAVSRGAYLDISDMLADYPNLVNSMPAAFWDAATVNGGIYAVPNQQIAARTPSWYIPEEYMDAFGWTSEDVDGKGLQILDMLDYAQFCYDNYGAHFVGPQSDVFHQYCGYELLSGYKGALAVKVGDSSCTVVNFYDTPEFKQMCEDMAVMYDKGLVDSLTMLDNDQLRAEMISGRVSTVMTGTYKPGGDINISNTYGIPIHLARYSTPLMTTSAIIATMWGISSTCQHPERVLEILEAFATDSYAMQMISYGIEGVHYDIVDGFLQLKENSGYNHGNDWAFGNVFLNTPLVGMPEDVWVQTAEINASADVSVLMGFSYSISNVEAEATNVSNTVESYLSVTTGELPVEDTLKEFNEKLKIGGIDTMIADAQAQIDAFLGK